MNAVTETHRRPLKPRLALLGKLPEMGLHAAPDLLSTSGTRFHDLSQAYSKSACGGLALLVHPVAQGDQSMGPAGLSRGQQPNGLIYAVSSQQQFVLEAELKLLLSQFA